MLQHTVPADVDTRIWNGTRDPDLIAWLGDDGHRFDGTQLVIHTTDGDTYPEPGWTIVRWPDNDLSVMSPRAAVKRLVPGARATDAQAAIQRVAALHDRWVKAGPPPLGTSISRWWDARLIELDHTLLGREAAEPPKAETQARDPLVRWYVERKDHDGWVPASSPTRPRESVVHTLAERRSEYPDHEFRLARATTAYSVEAE